MSEVEDTADMIVQSHAKAIIEAYKTGKESGQAERDLWIKALSETRSVLIDYLTGDDDDPVDIAVRIIDAALQEVGDED